MSTIIDEKRVKEIEDFFKLCQTDANKPKLLDSEGNYIFPSGFVPEGKTETTTAELLAKSLGR